MNEFKSLEYLREIDHIIMAGKQYAGFVFVPITKILNNIDKIYATLPVDVQERKKFDKSFEISPNIYDDLKNLEIYLNKCMQVMGAFRILKINETSPLILKLYEDMETVNKNY